ncbi:MAG: GTP-binding protein [Gemmatimonadales bacterium]|nr:MAG: GTP-binding protein [Gemmatimonadales bacterium]
MGLARRTEINTFVMDVKDATGFVSYPTTVPMALEVGADQELRIRNPRALLERLAREGVYPVARIVIFKDALLPEVRPDLAIQDSIGAAWVDGRGEQWVNPYSRAVWEYHVALAREAVELGFAEIQWDYVRFPDRPASELREVVYPGAEGRSRTDAIREFLAFSREELADLEVPVTADVFGVATTATSDVGIGQRWEDLVDVVDAILPMIYPSHYYAGSFGLDHPNAHPYTVVRLALEAALRRSGEVEGAARIIPWLQDFSLGEPRYGAEEVRAQIRAVHDVGIQEWILWNASGRYTEEALRPEGDAGEAMAPSWGSPAKPSSAPGAGPPAP